MLLVAPNQTAANTADVQQQQFNIGLESFGTRLFAQLAEQHPKQNIVISPFSIQTCLAMARLGAEGKTAHEIDQALALSDQKPEDLANNYHAILEKYENSSLLQMANKIYAMTGYAVQDKFNELLSNQFYSSVDSIDFAKNVPAAQTINTWVEDKTNHMIKDLIDPSKLNSDTRLVLVNAIYFKGDWVHEFSADNTHERDFYLDDIRTTKVQMMRTTKYFKYADLPELDAKALEMPYKNSDLSMLIILPNKRTGLVELEKKLQNTRLSSITEQMHNVEVIVDIPKFKAEFEAELSEPLSKLGMQSMFKPRDEFGKMLKEKANLYVSSVVHKAFIEVNEKGTEAAAATGILQRKKRALDFVEIKDFNVDHPFLFKILAGTSTPASCLILFAGRIAAITQYNLSTKDNFVDLKDEL